MVRSRRRRMGRCRAGLRCELPEPPTQHRPPRRRHRSYGTRPRFPQQKVCSSRPLRCSLSGWGSCGFAVEITAPGRFRLSKSTKCLTETRKCKQFKENRLFAKRPCDIFHKLSHFVILHSVLSTTLDSRGAMRLAVTRVTARRRIDSRDRFERQPSRILSRGVRPGKTQTNGIR